MVARVRLDELRELARGNPVELAAVDDDAAERRAVAADELRSRVDDDVRAILERAQLIRRRERAVDDERDVVLVRDVSDSLDVDEVGIRIADGLDVDNARVLLDRPWCTSASSAYVTAAAPEATETAATPPSSAAMRLENTSSVGFVRRP